LGRYLQDSFGLRTHGWVGITPCRFDRRMHLAQVDADVPESAQSAKAPTRICVS
jgi:hypothetical protein